MSHEWLEERRPFDAPSLDQAEVLGLTLDTGIGIGAAQTHERCTPVMLLAIELRQTVRCRARSRGEQIRYDRRRGCLGP